ncbi:hypothetical protein LguiB_033046 [Lonicera macranthoides]
MQRYGWLPPKKRKGQMKKQVGFELSQQDGGVCVRPPHFVEGCQGKKVEEGCLEI